MDLIEWHRSQDVLAMLLGHPWLQGPRRLSDPSSTLYAMTPRRVRLFLCACIKQLWQNYPPGTLAYAVKTAEEFADGNASFGDLCILQAAAAKTHRDDQPIHAETAGDLAWQRWHISGAVANAVDIDVHRRARTAVAHALQAMAKSPLAHGAHIVSAALARLLRDVVTYHFVPPAPIAEHERTAPVMAVAEAVYDDRPDGFHLDGDGLAALADALEDAGHTDDALLRHLRGWQVCDLCHGRKQIRQAGDKGDSDNVVCTSCTPDTPRRAAGFTGPDAGWVKTEAGHVRGCWALDAVLQRP